MKAASLLKMAGLCCGEGRCPPHKKAVCTGAGKGDPYLRRALGAFETAAWSPP